MDVNLCILSLISFKILVMYYVLFSALYMRKTLIIVDKQLSDHFLINCIYICTADVSAYFYSDYFAPGVKVSVGY